MEVIEHSIADGTNSQGRSGEITNEENVPVVQFAEPIVDLDELRQRQKDAQDPGNLFLYPTSLKAANPTFGVRLKKGDAITKEKNKQDTQTTEKPKHEKFNSMASLMSSFTKFTSVEKRIEVDDFKIATNDIIPGGLYDENPYLPNNQSKMTLKKYIETREKELKFNGQGSNMMDSTFSIMENNFPAPQ